MRLLQLGFIPPLLLSLMLLLVPGTPEEAQYIEDAPMAAPFQRHTFRFAGEVTAEQDWGSPNLGSTIWHAGVMLAHAVDHLLDQNLPCASHSHNLTGCLAVELGSGCSGLASIVFARLGGRAVATDGDAHLAQMLGRNLERAGVAESVSTVTMRWGDPVPEVILEQGIQCASDDPNKSRVDVVLAADVVYSGNADHWGALIDSFGLLSGPETIILLAHTRRNTEEKLFLDMVRLRFNVNELFPGFIEPRDRESTRIYQLKKLAS